MKILINKKGFTLVEILLVVGFIALASIGIYAVYNKINISHKAVRAFQQVNLLHRGISQLYGNSHSYGSLSTSVVMNGQLAPTDMINTDTNTLVNPFGGAVRTTVLNAGESYAIILQAVPADACVKIGAAAAGSIFDFRVGGTGWVGSTAIKITTTSTVPVSYDLTRLVTACDQDTGAGIAMAFVPTSK